MKTFMHKIKPLQLFPLLALLLFASNAKTQSLTFTASPQNQCFQSGGTSQTVAVNSGSTFATSYSWTTNTSTSCSPSYSPLPASNGSVIIINYPCCGVYIFTCTAYNSSTFVASSSLVNTVTCSPTISISGPTLICPGTPATLTASGAQNYTWSTGTTGNFLVTSPSVSTTYSVAGQNLSGCMTTKNFSINIIPSPQPSFTYIVGSNGAVTFSNISTNTISTTTYTWSFGDGNASTTASPSHTYNANGSYTVTLHANSGCGSSFTAQVIPVSSVPNLSCAVSFSYLSNGTGTYTFTSTSANTSSSSIYYWNFGNNTTYSNIGVPGALPPPQTYTSGTYTVNLKVLNTNPLCIDSAISIISYSPCILISDFDIIPISNTTFSFVSTSSGTNSSSTYSWTYGDTGAGSGGISTHTYNSPGIYTVTLLVSNSSSCSAIFSKTLQVHGCNLASNFTHTTAANGLVTFSNTSTNLSGSTQFFWNFGDGVFSTISHPNHVYSNAGTYLVLLRIQDSLNASCKDSLTQSINVTGIPCSANSQFTVQPTNIPQYWTIYPAYPYNVTAAIWYWGDGTQSNSLYASHLYTVAGSYSICLSVTVSCGANSTFCHSYFLNKNSESAAIISINVLPPPLSTGVSEVSENLFRYAIFPNPNKGEFNITSGTQEGNIQKVEVINVLGDLVYTFESTEAKHHVKLNVKPGIYFVRLSSGKQHITKKIIVTD